MKNLFRYLEHYPKVDSTAFIAAGAKLIGDVTVREDSTIWYNAVLRADCGPITIGRMTNIQDNCILHSREGEGSITVGNCTTVRHGAIVNACVIEDYCLICIGAIVLDSAVVGRGSIIGSGAVVTKGAVIPPFSLVLGVPGKIVKTLDESSLSERIKEAEEYFILGQNNKNTIQ